LVSQTSPGPSPDRTMTAVGATRPLHRVMWDNAPLMLFGLTCLAHHS
jgi:hypothetical protein